MKGKIKYLVIIALLIGFTFTFTSTIAYWSTEVNTSNLEIEVSEQTANLEVVDLSGTIEGWLVPEGYALFEGEVSEIVLQYEISLDKELIRTVDLIVETLEVTIGGESTYAHLVEVSIGGENDSKIYDLYNDKVTVIIKVRLKEPIDSDEALEKGLSLDLVNVEDSLAAYESIKGQEINLKIGFRVET